MTLVLWSWSLTASYFLQLSCLHRRSRSFNDLTQDGAGHGNVITASFGRAEQSEFCTVQRLRTLYEESDRVTMQ